MSKGNRSPLQIYKASAGSGKTFHLAKEYIIKLLGAKKPDGTYTLRHIGSSWGIPQRHILAITFTNKATEEMKSRIIHELAVLAHCEPEWQEKSLYESDLISLFGCSSQQLQAAARKALSGLLFDTTYFSVSTIDSFFQTILRTFAREAELSGNYRLEIENETVITESVNTMLSDLNHTRSHRNTQLSAWIRKYMLNLVEQGKTFNIFNRDTRLHSDLIKFIKNLSGEDFLARYDEIVAYLSDTQRLIDFARHLTQRLQRKAADTVRKANHALDILTTNLLIEEKIVKATVVSLLSKIIDHKGLLEEDGKTCPETIASIDYAYNKSKADSPLRTPNTDTAIMQAVEAQMEMRSLIPLTKAIINQLYTMGLLGRVYAEIDDYRRENDTILLSDTNALLEKIIGGESTPFVYERVGLKYRHFLIDEFQDTSRLQWANIQPLLEESLSTQSDNLLIGDLKQCIYRFRGSDPSLIKNIHLKFPDYATVIGTSLDDNTNWRSSSAVVQFNNTFFSILSREMGFSEEYSGAPQLIAPKNEYPRGYVKALYAEKSNSEAEAPSPEEAVLTQMTDEIKRQLKSGYSPGEIVVLVRSAVDGMKVIDWITALGTDPENDFPVLKVVSDNALEISRARSVRLVISVLRYIASSDFASSPRKKSDRQIASMINNFEFGLSQGLDPDKALLNAIRHVSTNDAVPPPELVNQAQDMECVNLISIVERIISGNALSDQDRKDDCLYLQAFQDLVADFVHYNSNNPASFIKWWDEKGHEKTVPGATDPNAINVLTIHKSKGLEFKCVHVPFASFRLKTDEIRWFDTKGLFPDIPAEIVPPLLSLQCSAKLENSPFGPQYKKIVRDIYLDELNVLYVAFTRAIDELIIGITTPERCTSLAPNILSALRNCGQTAYENLLQTHEIPPKRMTPFAPLHFTNHLVLGTPCTPIAKEKRLTALQPRISVEIPPYHATDASEIWANTKRDSDRQLSSQRQRGIILHDLLSKIKNIHQLKPAITSHLRAGIISQKEASEIESLLSARLSNPEVAKWFTDTKRVLIERPIVTHCPSDPPTLRPDRVVWTSEGTIDIIDYKFGIEREAKYTNQVRRYISLFSRMGYKNLRGFIWYVDAGEIARVI